MTESALDKRLHHAMGGGGPGGSAPDPAVLASILDRAARDQGVDVDNTRPSTQPDQNQRGSSGNGSSQNSSKRVPVLATGAALAVIVGAVLALMTVNEANTNVFATDPATPDAVDIAWPTPPSWWWIAGLALLCLTVVLVVRRVFGSPVLTIATACAAVGLLAGMALLLPHLRTGAELAREAPTIEGFELIEVDLFWWPDRTSDTLGRLLYRGDLPTAENDDVQSIAADVGFADDSPSRSSLDRRPVCLRTAQPNDTYLWDGKFYCINGYADNQLEVNVVSYRGDGLLWPRLVAYPLLWLAALLVGLHMLSRRGPEWEHRHPIRRQVIFGVALLFFSAALFLAGLPAYDLARVDGVISGTSCTGIEDCRQQLTPLLLDHEDVITSALRIYAIAYFFGYFLAAFFIAIGWGLALTSEYATAGPSSGRRMLFLVGVTGLCVVLAIGAPIVFGDTLLAMTDFNE